MIYLTDRGFRIKSALNILVYQCNYPGIYNGCFCLGCNDNDNADDNVIDKGNVNVNDNDNVIDNDDDLRSSFANNDNANDSDNDIHMENDLRSSFANNDNVNDNDNDNDNNNDNDNFIYLLDEKHGETWVKPHQKVKLYNNSPTNSIPINTNDDLKSWLNDDDIITEATFPNNLMYNIWS